jgi:hypothetical protein
VRLTSHEARDDEDVGNWWQTTVGNSLDTKNKIENLCSSNSNPWWGDMNIGFPLKANNNPCHGYKNCEFANIFFILYVVIHSA